MYIELYQVPWTLIYCICLVINIKRHMKSKEPGSLGVHEQLLGRTILQLLRLISWARAQNGWLETFTSRCFNRPASYAVWYMCHRSWQAQTTSMSSYILLQMFIKLVWKFCREESQRIYKHGFLSKLPGSISVTGRWRQRNNDKLLCK